MQLILNNEMLDLMMPLCRQHSLTPKQIIKKLLENETVKAQNNGKEETKQN